jgi:hypothetical protein
MDLTGYQVRRATTEDLEELYSLWQFGQLPAPDLEKSFTEFQVVVAPSGALAGAIGMRLSGLEACLHHETFSDFGLADPLRPLLWQRLQNLARNHGIFRLWTQEPAPFWRHEGFAPANGELLGKLPAQFGDARRPWLSLQIKDERALPESIDREFARFREMEQERTQRMLQRATSLRWLANILAIALFLFVVFGAIYLLRPR